MSATPPPAPETDTSSTDTPTADPAASAVPAPSKAGRDLRAAVGVGLILAGLVIGSILIDKRAFLAVLVAAMIVGAWELRVALAGRGLHAPAVPAIIAAIALPVTAYVEGPTGLVLAYGWVLVGLILWRVADGLEGAARDLGAGALLALYPAFLGGFASLLLAAPDGERRIVVFVLVTVFSDIGGYAVGVLLGRHPMAPSISPKKSWEGFAGSVMLSSLVGAIALPILLDGLWWQGAVLGAVAAATATIGDLMESSIKRDLGVKDMSNLLPGHGGLMDRLDSLILSVAPVWALLLWFVPLP